MIDIFLNYLPRFYDWLLKTTIMASILVGLILVVKTLLRNKLTPRWHYLLWMILIVRLLLPWSQDSSYSIYSILSKSYKMTTSFQTQFFPSIKDQRNNETKATLNKTVVMEEEHNAASTLQTIKESNKETSNKEKLSNEKQKDKPISVYTSALYIWLIGVFILGFKTYRQNSRLMNLIKKQPVITDKRILDIFNTCKKSMSVQKDIPLILSGVVSNPTVFGFFRPKILLSIELINRLTEQQLRHIFYHELAHIKRRDVGFNWLIHNLLILHWFNPILWFAYIYMREDQELACDAYALTFMEEEEKIPYGHTIITLLEQYSKFYQVPSMANLSRNKRTLKRRIFMIKKFQKKSYRWSALGVIAVLAVSSLSLLNAHADESNGKQKELPQTIENKKNNTVYIPPKKKENYKDMTKEEILTKMINTVDNFETARGEFKINYGSADAYSLIDYELSLNHNDGGYSKTSYIQNGTEKASYTYYKDGTEWDLNQGSATYREVRYLTGKRGTLNIKDAFTVNNKGETETKMRERPPGGEPMHSLFPYEVASYCLRDLNAWKIEKQNEGLLGHNTIVIDGKFNYNAQIKQKANTFRFWVDKDTGILVKFETYNSAGDVVYYLYTIKLEINVPIDSKNFIPKLNGYKKFDRSSIKNGPGIMTGKYVDNEIPKELKGQWEEAKKKPNETTILHQSDNWYIFVKKGYLVDGIEVNGKDGKLLLAKASPQKSQFNFSALAERYKVDNLKIVYE